MFDIYSLLSGFAGALITGFVGYFGIVKKTKADETSIALTAWKELLLPLQDELRQAKEEIQELRQALEKSQQEHKRENERLIRRIKDLQRGQDILTP